MENDIMNIMNDIKYGYLDINGNIHFDIDEAFDNKYKLQSPNETLNNNYDDTNLFIFKYSKPRYGINLLEFYHHCENGEKVK